jgi:hypothetical protein
MVHIYNPRHLGGGSRRIMVLGQLDQKYMTLSEKQTLWSTRTWSTIFLQMCSVCVCVCVCLCVCVCVCVYVCERERRERERERWRERSMPTVFIHLGVFIYYSTDKIQFMNQVLLIFISFVMYLLGKPSEIDVMYLWACQGNCYHTSTVKKISNELCNALPS